MNENIDGGSDEFPRVLCESKEIWNFHMHDNSSHKYSQKVVVLLSSYNGEKYIEEQLNSISRQIGVDVYCIIRDEGSTDNTRIILKRFCQKHKNFNVIEGSNIGCINSFNKLMKEAIVDKYNWIAFSDQDDIWLQDKLISAIKFIEEHYRSINIDNIPICYCSNLLVFNEKTGDKYLRRNYIPKANKYTVLVQNYGTGCTMVFNQKAREFYNYGYGTNMEWHDYWMTIICTYFGRVFYDPSYHIMYRLHGNNQVGAYKKNVYIAFKNLYKQKNTHRIVMLEDFIKTYERMLDNSDKKILSDFISYKYKFFNRLKMFFNKKYHGYELKVTLNFKLRLLLGKIF